MMDAMSQQSLELTNELSPDLPELTPAQQVLPA